MVDDKQKKDQLSKRDLKSEVSKLEKTEAKWNREPTVFDHLPPHERPFNIEPFRDERERLPFKMTDADRGRRQKWIESQSLTDREPVYVPELEKMIFNPIRRLYRAPANMFFKTLEPVIGIQKARHMRWLVPKVFIVYFGALAAWYQLKYYTRTWEGKYGWLVFPSNRPIMEGEPIPPKPAKDDYHDFGFKSRKVFKGDDYAF